MKIPKEVTARFVNEDTRFVISGIKCSTDDGLADFTIKIERE